jgi:hypothetical protein
MMRGKMRMWAFGAVTALCFIAAVVPAFRGGRLNVIFVACGLVFLIIAATVRRRTPPAA